MPAPAKNDAKQVPAVHLLVRLTLPDKPTREFSYDFRQEVITIGRDPGNDIQIPLTTVSRRHSRIFYELGDFFLEDLGSTHGTNHNNKKLARNEKRLLRDGDSIAVLSFSLVFKTTSGTMMDRQPGEKTEQLAKRMVEEVLSSLGGPSMEPPCLRVMDGSDEGRRLELGEDQAEVTLGRSPECDFPLNDQNISRRHALLKRTWNGFTVQDLGSKNGVLVNGKRAEGPAPIKDGDELQIGSIKLTFIDPASRILTQLGISNDDVDGQTVGADGEGPPPEEEAAALEEQPAEEDPPPEPEPEPEPPASEAAPDPAEGDPDVPEGAAPVEAGDLPAIEAPKSGIAEVLILAFGALFLLGAIGAAIFLYL